MKYTVATLTLLAFMTQPTAAQTTTQFLTLAETADLERQVAACWSTEAAHGLKGMRIPLRIVIDDAATITSVELADRTSFSNPTYRAAVETAVRAAKSCRQLTVPTRMQGQAFSVTLALGADAFRPTAALSALVPEKTNQSTSTVKQVRQESQSGQVPSGPTSSEAEKTAIARIIKLSDGGINGCSLSFEVESRHKNEIMMMANAVSAADPKKKPFEFFLQFKPNAKRTSARSSGLPCSYFSDITIRVHTCIVPGEPKSSPSRCRELIGFPGGVTQMRFGDDIAPEPSDPNTSKSASTAAQPERDDRLYADLRSALVWYDSPTGRRMLPGIMRPGVSCTTVLSNALARLDRLSPEKPANDYLVQSARLSDKDANFCLQGYWRWSKTAN